MCRKCGLTARVQSRVGELHGTLKITKELGGDAVICKCIKCGNSNKYNKYYLVSKGTMCKTCSIHQEYRGKRVNDIKVIDLKYTGRDGLRYFDVTCIRCGDSLILNEDEIPKYKCKQ